jgi:hypothetical protein
MQADQRSIMLRSHQKMRGGGKMNLRDLNAMTDRFDASTAVEGRKESTFSQSSCGDHDVSTITWSNCGNT